MYFRFRVLAFAVIEKQLKEIHARLFVDRRRITVQLRTR